MSTVDMSGSIEQFLQELERGLSRTMVTVNKELTMRERIKRSWSMRQCARFLNISHQHLTNTFALDTDIRKKDWYSKEYDTR